MNLNECISLRAHADDTPVDGRQVRMHGLPITIEHPRGTIRTLHDDSGNVVYKQHMHYSYGFFNGTKGRDGDEVDCFTGPIKDAKEVYVVHMKDMGPVPSEREDEDKCMIGFQSADAAKAAFLMHYPPSFYDGMTALPVALFKKKMAQARLPHRKKKITADATSIGIVGDPGPEKHLRSMPKFPPKGVLTNSRLAQPAWRRKESAEKDLSNKRQSKPINLLRSARSILRKLVVGRAATKSRCPKCGGKHIVLMPTDYETAKCKDCGKTWQIKAGCSGPASACSACGNCHHNRFIAGGKKIQCPDCGHTWKSSKSKVKAGSDPTVRCPECGGKHSLSHVPHNAATGRMKCPDCGHKWKRRMTAQFPNQPAALPPVG